MRTAYGYSDYFGFPVSVVVVFVYIYIVIGEIKVGVLIVLRRHGLAVCWHGAMVPQYLFVIVTVMKCSNAAI